MQKKTKIIDHYYYRKNIWLHWTYNERNTTSLMEGLSSNMITNPYPALLIKRVIKELGAVRCSLVLLSFQCTLWSNIKFE